MAADTVLLPVEQLSEELRHQIGAAEGDYVVTRRHSRTAARIVDSDSARLLQEFRQPVTVVQAVIRYCSHTQGDPEATLDAAFPMLERLVLTHFLVEANSQRTQGLRPLLEPGTHFAETTVLECRQTLEDTDLYRVKTVNGDIAALKLLRPEAAPEVERMFEREAFVLRHLDATITPTLLAAGAESGSSYLLLSWCPGSDCTLLATRLRCAGDYTQLLRLCRAILDAYARLHAQNVIHSDVHPGNILVDNDCGVRLVDFGLARIAGVDNQFSPGQRGGIGWFFEPEYASAARGNVRHPYSSMLGEQYSLAALLYFLITGKHYVDFSLEKDEMLRQIVEDEPRPLMLRGAQSWAALEQSLFKALAKDPVARFGSVAAFNTALSSVGEPATPRNLGDARASHSTALEALKRILDLLDGDAPLLQSGLTAAPKASVTYGSAGIACALYHVACLRQDAKLLALADLWAERSVRDSLLTDAWYSTDVQVTPETVGQVSPYHTESGVHFIRALIACSRGDVDDQQNAIDQFIAASILPCCSLDLTLGRSGTLLAASQLIAAASTDLNVNTAALRELGNNTVASIWTQLDSYAPIRECRQIDYTGIAHGWAGILYATLCWSYATQASPPHGCGERLNQLATLARRSGRQAVWSCSPLHEQHDAPPAIVGGWCHGSAGQVHLWLAAHSAIKDDRFLALAEAAAWHAADAATGNGTLCCGYSGQAYALLAVYRRTGQRALLRLAQALAEKAAAFYRDMSSTPDLYNLAPHLKSLYKGELGVAVLAADLEDPHTSAQPAFELQRF